LPGWQEAPHQIGHRSDAAASHASPVQPPVPPVR
jgi:hypothetical protein